MENSEMLFYGLGGIATVAILFLKRSTREFEKSSESLPAVRSHLYLEQLIYREFEKSGYDFGSSRAGDNL